MGVFGQFVRAIGHRPQSILSASPWMPAASLGTLVFLAMFAVRTGPAAAAEVDPDAIVLTSRVFDIPFQMDRGTKASLVRLYVSADRGKTWTQAAQQPLPIKKFHFEATADGDYWFTHATDLDPPPQPTAKLTPERKIFIDTTGPEIELNGGADSDGNVTAQLKLTDPHQVATLRVLYATDVKRQWVTVANAQIDHEGRFAIRPQEDWRQMSVHITATDSIGNASVQAKTFRRPRVAATKLPHLAVSPQDSMAQEERNAGEDPQAEIDAMHHHVADNHVASDHAADQQSEATAPAGNQLRAQTVAGPSDPPSYLLGPTAGAPPSAAGATPSAAGAPPSAAGAPPSAAGANHPAATSPNHSALQSPGAGPLRPSPGTLRSPAGANPMRNTPPPRNEGSNPRSLSTFGSAFGAATRPATRPIESTPAGRTARADSAAGNETGPRTLPASGLTAKLTPEGIEVLPTPQADPAPATDASATDTPSATNKPPAAAPTPAPEMLPAPTPEAVDGPTINLTPPRSPGDPITESLPLPAAETDPQTEARRSRTLEEAMRPITPGAATTPNPPSTPNRPGAESGPEQIPTPAPSSTPEDQRRYRAERAAELSREQQLRYDRAQLARTVPFRWSDSNRFSLEYELEAVGASGVEAVELYGSLDAGRTWKRWGADPDRTSPFDIETKGEGVFAFRIVVLGNNGLASPRPLPGDQPDIAVIVDQTLPEIKITSARYGEGDRTGSLIIRYECSDENLMNRPVSIAFSDSLDGPWTTIAAGLRNDGLYVWPADPKLPHEIYLRIDATDQAGNTGSYLLDQPIATGGLAPRARILGFRSR
ncbi:hypothetical protein [Stieleria mannarensis]|uniref:hypothetical protein n=1 Tax=Stieleria mannarensis TaxID=2755585 RepID=UPI0016035742|nr:hypothetical protein [Rhodopirellula sp. JC639]